ncbi:DUF2683 family protein [Parapedobacter flavus]
MGYLILHPDSSEKLTAIKAVLKALKVDFEESKQLTMPICVEND